VTTSVTGAKIGDFSWDLIRQRTKNGTKWWFNGDQLWLLRINGVFLMAFSMVKHGVMGSSKNKNMLVFRWIL
jgi:hypothetical protein